MRTTHFDRASVLAETNPDLTFVGDGIAADTCWTLDPDNAPVLVPVPGKRDTLTRVAAEFQVQATASHLMSRECGPGTPFFSNTGRFVGHGWALRDGRWLVIPVDPARLTAWNAARVRQDCGLIVNNGPEHPDTKSFFGF